MKTYINLLGIVCLSIAMAVLIGTAGCGPGEEEVTFLQANPGNGSTIEPDATIIVTFDSTPNGLTVTGGTFSIAETNVTIIGPFIPGTLNIVLTWADGAQALTYTVKPSIPPPPEGMVLIPGGAFEMGSTDENAQNDEQPVHTVYVDAFYMDETEVTNLDYKRFLLENPLWEKSNIDPWLEDGDYLFHWTSNNYPDGEANHPVTYVSWYAAMAYAQWAGKRLPTEAEWEKAARGGLVGNAYPNSNTINAGNANYDEDVSDTTSVRRYAPNNYGLYDMAGNVWELCLDEYDPDFYFSSPSENPLAGGRSIAWLINNFTSIAFDIRIVMRGGSWESDPIYLRVANRGWTPPILTTSDLGFRCVKDVSP